MPLPWYTLQNIAEVDTPALAIYPERIKKNISILKEFVSDTERLRPHVKTHKSKEVTRLMLAAGIEKFKCATIAEAEMLAMAGAPDVLLAYQPVGPKAHRLAQLVQQYPNTTFSCLLDNEAVAIALNQLFSKINHCLPVYVDLNVGMNRTGIAPGKEAAELYRKIQKMPGLLVMGLHAYDGHIRDTDMAARTARCNEVYEKVEALREELIRQGAEDPIIIAGGSPTFPIHAKRAACECSPGTFIYWDKGYHDLLPEQPFHYAALVITRIISRPSDDIICTDLGHKSIASENPLNKRVFFLNAPELEPIGQSEEHLVLKTNNSVEYKIGDVLYGVPYHVCPTCALYDTALVVTNNQAVDRWELLSRNRRINV